jgi:hypothetical protein
MYTIFFLFIIDAKPGQEWKNLTRILQELTPLSRERSERGREPALAEAGGPGVRWIGTSVEGLG